MGFMQQPIGYIHSSAKNYLAGEYGSYIVTDEDIAPYIITIIYLDT